MPCVPGRKVEEEAPPMKHLIPALILALGTAVSALAATQPPSLIKGVIPVYPKELKDQKISGTVTLSVLIDDQGVVQDATVVKTTNDAFSKPAIDAVRKWKFNPAQQDGKPVALRVSIPIKFTAPAEGDAKPPA
jgi:protein TonB